jgi:hypothetical protein
MTLVLSARPRESADPEFRNWKSVFAGLSGIVAVALLGIAAVPATAGVLDDDNYSIMKPEPTPPGVVKPYKSPRGANKRVTVPKHPSQAERRIPRMPPPIVNPRTGQAYPNLPPPVPGSGIGGRETGQDRAVRCAHQAGVYGQTGTNYLATCINQ